MKSVILIVLALMALSFLWSLFVGAIKLAILIGVALVVLGVLKAVFRNSDSSGST